MRYLLDFNLLADSLFDLYVEQGFIGLDHEGNLLQSDQVIILRQLLTHTSGLDWAGTAHTRYHSP